MNESTLYYVTVNWYNDMTDKNIDTKFFAFAPSLSNLSARIDSAFDYINTIKIESINTMCGAPDFFYVDSDDITINMIEAFRDANNY